jgi:hypothetical protein
MTTPLMAQRLLTQRLLALFAAGMLLLNFPLLRLWLGADPAAGRSVVGLPLLPLALFVIWGLLIAALALLMEGSGGGHGSTQARGPQ